MQRKFSRAFTHWIKLSDTSGFLPVDPIPFVSEFNYTPLTSIAERWELPLTITIKSSTELELSIPAFVPTSFISAPIRTVFVKCSIIAGSYLLAAPTKQTTDLKKTGIPFSNTPAAAQVLKI